VSLLHKKPNTHHVHHCKTNDTHRPAQNLKYYEYWHLQFIYVCMAIWHDYMKLYHTIRSIIGSFEQSIGLGKS